jgi:hypothetical protein
MVVLSVRVDHALMPSFVPTRLQTWELQKNYEGTGIQACDKGLARRAKSQRGGEWKG